MIYYRIKKNCDQFIMIFDLQGVGYSNLDMKQISKIAPILSVSSIMIWLYFLE